jgi:hypothetical protein
MPAGALAAFVLEKFLEIATARRSKAPSTWLFLRIFLRARSRVHSAVTPGLGKIISTGRLTDASAASARPWSYGQLPRLPEIMT